MKPEELIDLFEQKINNEKPDNNKGETDLLSYEIITTYFEILGVISKDYDSYKRYMPQFLSILENKSLTSISYSINVFFILYRKLISETSVINSNFSIVKENLTNKTVEIFLNALSNTYKEVKKIRISDFNFKGEALSEQEKREIASYLVNIIQDRSKEIRWTFNQSEESLINLAVLRWILIALNNLELFYYTSGMVIDRINASDDFQPVRDLAEEIIISSFIDKVPELGFFNSFRCYATQSSAQAAILYANLSLYCVSKAINSVSDKFIQDFIWQSIIYFRNTNLYPFAVKIYNEIPTDIKFDEYKKRAIDYAYFMCLLSMEDDTIADKIHDYLNSKRENILSRDYIEIIPWLVALYNIKRLYNNKFSQIGLGYYLDLFEMIVPKELVERQKNIISGESEKLKIYLKDSLIKLNNTRNKYDLVNDNETAIKIASRLIKDSFNKQDEEAILLAMMVKSDFTLIFQEQNVDDLINFRIKDIKLNNFDIELLSKEKFLTVLEPKSNTLFIWLAFSEGEIFQLSLLDNSYKFNYLNNWTWKKYRALLNSNYFSSIKFDDTIKDRGSVRSVLPEEHLQESYQMSQILNFAKLVIEENIEPIRLIKDMELAQFPHNLLLNENGSFIHLYKPLTNILSTEWYISHKNENLIEKKFSKSIWLPTEGGDFTLNQLFSTLEDYLNENEFNIFQDINLTAPISSDLNIICSHGDKDIALTQVIYPNDNPLTNLNRVLSSGKILIFFVCHSGSYQNEFFRNNITSIVKNFISQGYQAVIAPFWALHVYIPKIWLPVFISSLNNADSIEYAVYQANKAVYDIYPTPAAWACMHLYGNPHTAIAI